VVRIGVVADTHCPEFLPRLPDSLFERLAGVDLILHGGDVGGRETLRQLARIAPVEAVRGDHDRGLPELPERRRLTVAGRRIAIVHGNRSRLIEEPVTFLGTISLGRAWPQPGLAGWLRRQFPDADVVIYGHTHQASAQELEGAFLFNPGPVYVVDARAARDRLERHPNWFEWSWLQAIRHRRDRPLPSVGILELHEGRVTATVHRI
jgi:putative phosphoesterase